MRVNKTHGQDIYFPAGRLRYSSRLTNTGLNNLKDLKGTTTYNYHPITCLFTTWNMKAPIRHHNSSYMSTAQKVIGKNTRVPKHQLERAVQ